MNPALSTAPPEGRAAAPADTPPAPTPAGNPAPRSRSVDELTAADVMSSPVLTVSCSETLWEAWSLLYRSGLRHLVVADDRRCAGVLDDRRIALEWPLGPSRELARQVGQLVGGRARSVLADATVRQLARVMLRDRIDALPVVTPTGDVVGLVTASDLLGVLADPEKCA